MMSVTTVTPKSMLVGDKCKSCSKSVQAGEVIAWCRTDNFTKPRFTIHVSCMARMVEAAPAPVDVEFEQTRNRILETGDVWA